MKTAAKTLVLMTGLLAGCSLLPVDSGGPRPAPVPLSRMLDIRSVEKQLPGKTMPEVVATVGSPNRESGDACWTWWTYTNKFYDPITHHPLPVVTFVFRDGRFLEMTY
ncbi:MAG TPA: hypothetical protein VL171_04160 [Verrucomicrobiae bacterium]|nr:hypothetical protein [Verrucomicrobiae bacterium]